MGATPTVRLATRTDHAAVVGLVSALLVELGGEAIATDDAAEVVGALVEGGAGFVALGEVGGAPRAVCTVSFV